MAQGRKYAALPDLDEAPDTYETRESVGDTSTKSSRSSSAASSYQDPDETPGTDDEISSGIDRAQLQPGAARSQFLPARVDARGVDFSDRVGGRHSYKTTTKKKAKQFKGTAGYIDREDETFEEKVARLKREIEEVKAVFDDKQRSDGVDEDVVSSMSEVLQQLDRDTSQRRTREQAQKPAADSRQESQTPPLPQPSQDLTQLRLPDNAAATRALTLVATLESRLTSLESALGLPLLSLTTSTSITSTTPNTQSTQDTTSPTTTPILTTLSHLTHQLTTLNATTAPSLTALTTTIQSATASAEALTTARRAALAARKDLRNAPPLPTSMTGAATTARPFSSGSSFTTSRPSSYARSRAPTGASGFEATNNATATATNGDNPLDAATTALLLTVSESETASRVSKLFAVLPTLEALAPLLPSVLERLGDLKLLHAEAAGAAEALRVVESGLDRTGREVREWREAVEGLEGRMGEGEERWRGNWGFVEGLVGGLEGRVEALKGDSGADGKGV